MIGHGGVDPGACDRAKSLIEELSWPACAVVEPYAHLCCRSLESACETAIVSEESDILAGTLVPGLARREIASSVARYKR